MYWTNPALKLRAKEQLHQRWGNYLVVVFLYTLITELVQLVTTLLTSLTSFNLPLWLYARAVLNYTDSLPPEYAAAFESNFREYLESSFGALVDYVPTAGQIILQLALYALSILLTIFVFSVLEIGLNRWFMEARGGSPTVSTLFSGFGSGAQWRSTVWVMFCMRLFTGLWSLLFVIPGIVFMYQTILVPYLLAENPYMPRKRAFELSKALTRGEKARILVLQLSFIGWIFLSALAQQAAAAVLPALGTIVGFVGDMLVTVYLHATFAELYATMRDKAFQLGYSDATELAGFTA